MCGICGIYKIRDVINLTDKNSLIKMRDILKHRGPDEKNEFISERAGLGFCRLKIIGLSNGIQPIPNEDNSIFITCNGEIFNYKEIREKLILKGHTFRTESDVEVILHLYEEEETKLFEYLNGQFSFAIYDKRKHKLLLARDHFGILPLYYTRVNENTLLFGSEIKSILEYPGVGRKVDLTSLDQVFSLPGIVSPKTIFENIFSVEPGHFIEIEEDCIVNNKYWDICYPMEGEIAYYDESYYLERLGELLNESIRLRKVSDVPIGAYLSGGLDSSLIAKLANEVSPKLKAIFSMTFNDAFFNEEKYQKLMIDDLGIENFVYKFDVTDIYKNFTQVIWHSETPLKESYNATSLLLSKLAHNQNIKVILTGEGADELFAGYPSYKFDTLRNIRNKNGNVTECEKEYRMKLWGREDFFYEKQYSSFEESKKEIFSDKINDNYASINFVNYNLIDKTMIHNRNSLHARSYIDLKVRIADHLISDHGDRMLMANSVEGRYPFLDKNLVEFVTKIPPNLKLNHYEEKYLLKQYSLSKLPKAIVKREKFGFSAPGSPQLLQMDAEWINDILSYNGIKAAGYFNPDAVERIKKKYSSKGYVLNIPYEEDLLMPIITFGILKELYKIPNL